MARIGTLRVWQAAIAAAVSLRSYLLVTRKPVEDGTISLDFPDVNLHHTWHISALPWAMFQARAVPYDQPLAVLDPELTAALAPAIQEVSPGLPAEAQKIHHLAAAAFLYILMSLADPSFSPCSYTLRSTIPIASGLGSSASISVCLSMAILMQTGRISRQNIKPGHREATSLINNWAFVGELNMHGTPSGIDNTVATLGKAVLFKRNPPPQGPSITALPAFPTLPLLLVDTRQPRSTAAEVSKVRKLKETHPLVAECILEGIGKITESVHSLISHASFEADHVDSIQKLGELVRLNQGLLKTLGVSHPRIERICELVDRPSIGWSKLTGGGGGGCAFALLTPELSHQTLEQLEQVLREEGYERYETLLGGKGVGFLDLAHEDLKTIQITQETVRSMPDSLAVEAHVGITATHVGNHWKFFD